MGQKLGLKISKVLSLSAAAACAISAVRQAEALSYVNYDGSVTTILQNFDTLPGANGNIVASGTPLIGGTTYTLPTAPASYDLSTIFGTNTALTGWYAGAPSKNVFAANGGSTTTGGIYSFGAPSGGTTTDRALGMVSTSTSNVNEIGIVLYNNTQTTFNQITLSYNAELWHQGAAKTLNFGYAFQSTLAAMPTAGLITNLNSQLGSGSFTTGAAGSTDATTPLAVNAINPGALTIQNWAPNTYLWLTWTNNANTGSSQGIGIDDFSFTPGAAGAGVANVTWNTTTGTWDTTTGDWTGGSPTANQYKAGDNATFGTIASDSTITVSLTGAQMPGSTTFTNAANKYTFNSGGIGGGGAVSVNGAGTVEFQVTNTYTGGTYLNSGTLIVTGGDDRLGGSAGAITFAGGTLQTNTVGLGSSGTPTTRTIIINTGGGTFNTNGLNSYISGTITVTDHFHVIGGGNLNLSGTVSTSTGNGRIDIGDTAATTLDPTVLTLSKASGTNELGSDGGKINGNIVITGNTRTNFSAGTFNTSVVTGPMPEIQVQGNLTVTNDPTLGPVLGGGPNITNVTGSVGGTIAVNIHFNSLNTTGTGFTKIDVSAAGRDPTLNTVLFPTNYYVGTIGATKGPKTGLNGSTNHQANLIINGVISGYADLNISNDPSAGGGSGDITFNSQNSYVGATMINGNNSSVYIGINDAIPTSSDLVFGTLPGFGVPQFDLNGHNQSVNSLSWGGTGTMNQLSPSITNTGTGDSAFTVSGSTTAGDDFGGIIADGVDRVDGVTPRKLSFVKAGSSTLVLSGVYTIAVANTYSGGTTIRGGVLQAPNDAALGTSASALTFDGGALSFSDSADSISTINTSSDRALNVTTNGGIINTQWVDSLGYASTTNLTFTGVGGYSWASTAANPLAISGASGGSVTINGGAGTVTVAAGAVIQINAGATLNVAGAMLNVAGSSDPFTDNTVGATKGNHVSIVNNSTSTFNVTGGSVQVGSVTGVGNTTVAAGATLTAASITQNLLTVNGTANIITSSSGAVNVSSTGTLGGTASIAGPVTFASGGKLAPGLAGAAGTLTFNNTLALPNGANLSYILNTPNVAAGTGGNSLASVLGTTDTNGDLTIGTGTTLTVAPGGNFGNGVYHLISYTGALTNNSTNFNGWTVNISGVGVHTYTFQLGTKSIDLSVSSTGGGNNSVLAVSGSGVSLGRMMLGHTLTQNFDVSRASGTDGTTFSAAPDAGLTVNPTSGPIPPTTTIAVGVTNLTGLHSGNVTISNTGSGSTQTPLTIGVTGVVLDNRTLSATPVVLGLKHLGATVNTNTTVSTTGDDNHFTEVTLSGGTDTTDLSVASSATVFSTDGQNETRNVTGTLNTAGVRNVNISLTTTAAGLDASTPFTTSQTTLVNYTASVFNGIGKWTGTAGDGVWGSNSNWVDSNVIQAAPGTFAGFDNVDTANFDGTGTGTAVTLGAAGASLKNVNFSGGSGYTLSGPGTLTMKANSGAAGLGAIGAESHTVSTSVAAASDLHVSVDSTAALHLAGGIDNSAAHNVTLDSAGGTLSVGAVQNNGILLHNTGAASVGAVTGTGTTTVALGATLTAASITQNTLNVNGTVNVALNGTASGLSLVKSLNIIGGHLNLNDNEMIVNYSGGTDPFTTIRSEVLSGAITSAVVNPKAVFAVVDHANHPTITSLSGVSLSSLGLTDNKQVLIMYTYKGDANLDGQVTSADYTFIDNNFGRTDAGVDWQMGDFNQDGQITSADYTFIDTNFGAGTGGANGNPLNFTAFQQQMIALHTAEFGTSYTTALAALEAQMSGVPEPTSLGLLGFGAVALLARRRRNRI